MIYQAKENFLQDVLQFICVVYLLT